MRREWELKTNGWKLNQGQKYTVSGYHGGFRPDVLAAAGPNPCEWVVVGEQMYPYLPYAIV